MDLRTPLSKVRGLGSAKDGTHHWWMQRITAIANIPLVAVAVWVVLLSLRTDYAGVVNLVGHPFVGAVLILFIANLFYHAALGLQVVIEDYVHAHGVKIVSLILSRFAHVLVAVMSIYAILRIGLGA